MITRIVVTTLTGGSAIALGLLYYFFLPSMLLFIPAVTLGGLTLIEGARIADDKIHKSFSRENSLSDWDIHQPGNEFYQHNHHREDIIKQKENNDKVQEKA